MSGKRKFNSWMKTYRTVTEVDFSGVDQWEDGDVEIAFIEGYWSGQRDGINWLSTVLPNSRGGKSFISGKIMFWHNKLEKALAKRGDRSVIGGVLEKHERLCDIQKKYSPKTMTQDVALCKFSVMSKSKRLEVMENALGLMESDNSQSYDRCIARGVSSVLNVGLR